MKLGLIRENRAVEFFNRKNMKEIITKSQQNRIISAADSFYQRKENWFRCTIWHDISRKGYKII